MSVQARQVVFVRCLFSAGDFPTDRKFAIECHWTSTADENYCFALDRKTLIGPIDPSRQKLSPGYVLGILVGPVECGKARVECPDGDVYYLREDQYVVCDEEGQDEENQVEPL